MGMVHHLLEDARRRGLLQSEDRNPNAGTTCPEEDGEVKGAGLGSRESLLDPGLQVMQARIREVDINNCPQLRR